MTNSVTKAVSVTGMQTFPCRPSRGFTLIEMIAAFVIFAIAVGALMQILTMSMNDARRSADETRAALWAESLLDIVGIGERIEAGSSHGEFDRKYHWEMKIDQIDPQMIVADVKQNSAIAANANVSQALPQSAAGGFGMPQIDLFHVELEVIWGDNAHERTAKFSTLRTASSDTTRSQGSNGGDVRGNQPGGSPMGGARPTPSNPGGRN